MTSHQGQNTSGVPALPDAGPGETANYFQSLFSAPDANLYGWSPLHVYSSGVELFRQYDPPTQIYFIERGIVKLSCAGPSGKEMIIGLRRRNWLLGVPQAIIDVVSSATATTLTRCAMRCISAGALVGQLRRDLTLSVELNRTLSREIRGDLEKITTLGCMSAPERLRSFFHELIAEERSDELLKKDRLELPLKSNELAEIVAVSQQHLYRLLKDPDLKTHIKQGKSVLTIVDPLTLMCKVTPES